VVFEALMIDGHVTLGHGSCTEGLAWSESYLTADSKRITGYSFT